MKRRNENIVFGTDFCLAGYKKQRVNYTHTEAPKYYQFGRNLNPEEFFLAENLATHTKRTQSSRSRMGQPKSTDIGEIKKQEEAIQRRRTAQSSLFQFRTQVETLSEALMAKSVFPVTRIRGYYDSGASAFDAIRPVFDLNKTVFYPFPIILNPAKKVCLSISNIHFKTEYLEFPFETIDHIDIYVTLVRFINSQMRLVSNIVKIPLKPTKQGTWSPTTFNEYDFYIHSMKETKFYVEVVASVRTPSNMKPFVLKDARISEGYATFIEYIRGEYVPLEEQKLTIELTRNKKVPPAGQESYLIFDISPKDVLYPKLPVDFISPSDAIQAYNIVYKQMIKMFDPYTSTFPLHSPMIFEILLFWEVVKTDKVFQYVLENWDHQTIESLFIQVRRFYICSSLMIPTGPYPINSITETQDKLITHCASQIQRGKVFVNERFKPFHTNELRKNIIMYNNADW